MTALAVRSGLYRGWTEFRQSITTGQDIGWYLIFNGILVGVLLWQRSGIVEGTSLSLAALSMPSLLGMQVAFSGLVGIGSVLSIEREDGTLLRAKAVPHGMVGYLVGVIVSNSLAVVVSLLLILLPGLLLIDGVSGAGADGFATLLWVLALGLLATLPWGAVMGSLVSNPRKVWGWGMLSTMGLTAISGIFYPITALAGWLQAIAQVFPLYWLGLGMRAALLPDAAAVVEIGSSWRTGQTVGVLTIWAVVGLLLAPGVLRRMARGESGSAVDARRAQAIQRI